MVKKYEYTIEDLEELGLEWEEVTVPYLNEFGKDGWALCGITNHVNTGKGVLIFRRELKE